MPCHIIQRGNDKQACFFTDRDYLIYLDKLSEYSQKYGVAIHSFVLMTNHVHLLCTPQESHSISQMQQSIGRYFVRYFNSTYKRTGTLWEGRFKASLVDSDAYLLTVSKYIELNPVRARMVSHPAEYPWSSYRSNGVGVTCDLITPHPLYNALGRNAKDRQTAYRALFADNQLSDHAISEIRIAANKSWVLGKSEFKKHVEKQLGRKIPPLPKGGHRTLTVRECAEPRL